MLIIIWILLIVLGFIFKKSSKIVAIQLLFISFMITFNNGNPDQADYLNLFDRVNKSFKQIFTGNILYNLLMRVFGVFNNYNIAIFLLSFLSLIILYKGLNYYTDKIAFVLSFYLLAPFTIDATQLKNFITMCIWIYFSKFLFEAYKERNVLKNIGVYIIGVAIACSFHFSFIFTLVYVLVLYIDRKHAKKFFIGLLIACILYFGLKNIQAIIHYLESVEISYFRLIASKFNAYSANYINARGNTRFITTIVFFGMIFFAFVLQMFFKPKLSDNEAIFRNFVVKLTILSLLVLPLITYSIEIYRMQRNLLFIYYIMAAYEKKGFKIKTNKWIINGNIIFTVFAFFASLYYMYIESILWNYDSVFKILFKF